MATPQVNSSASSITATEANPDLESQRPNKTHVSHFQIVFDQAGVTPEVLAHKYQGQGTAESPYVVEFLPQDPRNPMLFSKTKKWSITLLQAVATLAVAFVSTAFSGGIFEVIADFGISREVSILGQSFI